MNNRKLFALVCAAALLSCAGCGSSETETTAAKGDNSSSYSSENTTDDDSSTAKTTTKKSTTKGTTTTTTTTGKSSTTSTSTTTTKSAAGTAANANNAQNNNNNSNNNNNTNNNSNSGNAASQNNSGNTGNNSASGNQNASNNNTSNGNSQNAANNNSQTETPAQDDSSTNDAVAINLTGNGANTSNTGAVSISGSTITIVQGGKYEVTGDLSNGQIIVNASKEDKVDLYFDGVGISCSSSAPLYVLSADTCTLHLVEGSNNYVEDTASNALSACIFSKDDLTIKGGGSLSVYGNKKHGIKSNNDVKIKNGNLTISAVSTGVYGEDSVQISGGNTVIASCKDGIKASNETEAGKGYIEMEDGYVDIQNAAGNGLEAITGVTISAGVVNVHSSKKAVNCEYQSINAGCLVTY